MSTSTSAPSAPTTSLVRVSIPPVAHARAASDVDCLSPPLWSMLSNLESHTLFYLLVRSGLVVYCTAVSSTFAPWVATQRQKEKVLGLPIFLEKRTIAASLAFPAPSRV